MRSLIEMFRLRAESKGLKLILELGDVPQFITTDFNKLRQVVINLLNNAVKFTDSGSITVRIHSEPDESTIHPPEQLTASPASLLSPVCSLHVEVEDTGIGIAPADLELIFEAFSQAAAGKHSTEGTGLGLTIS